MIKLLSSIILLGVLAGCQTVKQVDGDLLAGILTGEHRKTENKARDQYRHPKQTLEFFGVTENMTVVEIWPGQGGWYTEILAPLLRDQGKLYAAQFDPNSKIAFFQNSHHKFQQKLLSHPKIYDQVAVTILQPPSHLDIAPAGSVDRVLTFRNIHNWMKADQADAVFAAIFRALKPGGILGIVEHRGTSGSVQDKRALSGYVNEKTVATLANKAGFKLIDKSEINANPVDNHNHAKGVWTLPPTLRLQDKDRGKYLAIGESDRMTLKFIKCRSGKGTK